MKLVVATGGFDPLHSGHVEYLREAKKLGDLLIVGLNSDDWLARKKGQSFMPLEERRAVVGALKDVDATMTFDDSDGTAIKLLEELKRSYSYATIIFVNGGDRTNDNIPEKIVKDVDFVFDVGGGKSNSSSWILNRWRNPIVERPWGSYRVLYESPYTKVKELIINPNSSLSSQYHNYRSEQWHVVEGIVTLEQPGGFKRLHKHDNICIREKQIHKFMNETDQPVKCIEIQFGDRCEERDIVRL